MKYVIGLDIGTSGTKALLVDEEGRVTGAEQISYDFDVIKDGWYEQNPQLWWDATIQVITKLLINVKKEDVTAISLSGQMHSVVIVDKQGEVIRPAILWNDTRTTQECLEIEKLVGGKANLLEHVANPALEGFSAGKLLWIKHHEPNNYKKIHKVLMPKDYIGYKLTNEYYTDKSDASGTLFMDVRNGVWHEETRNALHISKEILPPIKNSDEIIGTVSYEASTKTGLLNTCLVIAGGADNACAALGNGILHNHDSLISIGTSGTIISYVKGKDKKVDGNYHLFAHCINDDLYSMSVMLSSGLSLKWLCKELLKNSYSYDEICTLAKSTDIGSGGVFFLPYLCGERSPHPNADASGCFMGMQASTKQEDIFRSVLEGIGYGCKECLDLMDDTHQIKRLKITGGGAKSPVWVQIISDILGRELEVADISEGPAYGAALLAGIGSGMYTDIESIWKHNLGSGVIYYPNPEHHQIYCKYFKIYKNIYKVLLPIYKDMKKIKGENLC